MDPSDERPIYRQIADQLRGRILDGTLAGGQLLPSETQLMQESGAARSTVRQAISALRNEGLVDTRQGRGAFVRVVSPLRRRASDRYSAKHRTPGKTPFTVDATQRSNSRLEVVRFARTAAGDAIAERLDVSPDTLVLARSFRWHTDDRPVQLSTSYVLYDLVKDTPVEDPSREPWPGGTIAQMDSVGVEVTEVTEDVRTRAALPDETRALALRAGAPVLDVQRTMHAGTRRVETADIVMAGDQYILSYRIPIS